LTKPVQPGRLLKVLTHERGGNRKGMTKKNGDPRNTTETRAIDLLAEARVLVVEDDPINLKVILRMLAQMGCRADTAIDGKAALEKIEQGAYDLVLMDCQMPELDGYETTRTIRRREGTGAHLPIVALTAHARQGDRKKCLEAGMDDYISKPMGPKDLKAALLRWLPGPAEQQTPSPDLDPETIAGLRELADGDTAFFCKLIRTFDREANANLALLRQAAGAGDSDTLWRVAHTLKGQSSAMGARAMVTMSTRLESLGKSGELSSVAVLIESLENEFHRVQQKLDLHL